MICKASQKTQNFFQENDNQTSKTSSITSSSSSKKKDTNNKANKVVWANIHLVMADKSSMQNQILLDSRSSTSVFCNEKYCNNIIPPDTVEIKTNGGSMYMN